MGSEDHNTTRTVRNLLVQVLNDTYTHRCSYLVAKFMKPIFGCGTNSLRALNVLASCLICLTSYDILRLLRFPIEHQDNATNTKRRQEDGRRGSSTLIDANTALNIALFPPLSFFSALFYTDVMSTLAVLLSYSVFLRKKTASGSLYDNLITILIGVVALLFRQTNIFWVAVFPAGLAVTAAVKADKASARSSSSSNVSEVLQKSWEHGYIHDIAVQDATFLGMKTPRPFLSLAVLTSQITFFFPLVLH